jgi:hypothetical protein
MRLRPLDRLRQQADLLDMTQNSRPVILLIPKLTPVSLDTDMQAGLDVSQGDGTGQVAEWLTYELHAFIMNVTQNLVTFGQVPPGVEVGDVVFHVSTREDEVVKQAYANPYHYVYLDGETFRITSLAVSDTGREQARVCGCKHFTPSLYRHSAY